MTPVTAGTLSKVLYDQYPHEPDVLGLSPGTPHCIDRQILLVMTGGNTWFVSWTDEPEQFCVGYRSSSHFRSGETILRDASQHPYWSALIAQQVSFDLASEGHQVLEIRAGKSCVFVSSQEDGKWSSDSITVSDVDPRGGVHKR